jgi:peptide/nickel transport system permease protein
MAYLRDRVLQALVTVWGIVTLSFFLNKSMPGGPIEALEADIRENPYKYGVSQNPTDTEVNRVVESLVQIPPNKPIWEAYVDYMVDVFVHLDFGQSITMAGGVDVTQLILLRAPWTVFLSTIGLLYGAIIGIALGSVMAYYEGTSFDIGMSVSIVLSRSIPYYIAAIFLLFLFGFQWGWFPTGGHVNPDLTPGLNWPWVSSVFYHATLPALSFILTGFGGRALGMRANAVRLLGSEYVRNARLRGLSTSHISITYLARNAVLPIWTSIVVSLGGLLGGSVILERIFQYPGMGDLMFEAAILRDFPVLMASLIMVTVLFVIGTLIADFTYPLIDPRAEMKTSRE